MKETKPTVTIAIPALNEAANIGYLLDDLDKQNQCSFILEKIIVNSDGSTDKTNEIVKSKNDTKLVLIENKETKGAAVRQNEMFRLCTSTILVLLDADIEITDFNFIEKLIAPVVAGEADLTSCPIREKEPNSVMEKALFVSMQVKNKIFEELRDGNNVYTCHGTARAFSKRFYKNFEFIESPGEDAYSYFYCIKNGFKYRFVRDAYVRYRLSDNLADYRKQNLRFIRSKALMAEKFGGEYIRRQYEVPMSRVVVPALMCAIKHPGVSLLYLFVYGVSSLSYRFSRVPSGWGLSESSKLVRRRQEIAPPGSRGL
jgi:glycosyltransferase involved in cell wall biosynthesis